MAKTRKALPPADLYAHDFYSWALTQAALLCQRRFAELDLADLAEEVEDLGRRQASEPQSRFEARLTHLLTWMFQPERRSHSCVGTITRERGKIAEHLEDNPGLKASRHELFARPCRHARADAVAETNLPLETFPAACPWTLDEVMDDTFWPGPD
jgi:hypothetical protein